MTIFLVGWRGLFERLPQQREKGGRRMCVSLAPLSLSFPFFTVRFASCSRSISLMMTRDYV
jgi:hypothetical protein